LAILLTFISNFIVTIYSIKKIDINRIKKWKEIMSYMYFIVIENT
jgi:hypothetical protein